MDGGVGGGGKFGPIVCSTVTFCSTTTLTVTLSDAKDGVVWKSSTEQASSIAARAGMVFFEFILPP